jgi:hypothetical protein
MKQSGAGWSESHFEKWFIANPVLPGGEPVFMVKRHRLLRRDVDLLALSADGGLILIEVKNERTTREAVGQSLEYLARFAETDVEQLQAEYGTLKPNGDMQADFRKAFNRELKLTQERRVYLVAPSFDLPSEVCVSYLGEQLRGSSIKYGLIRARPTGAAFTIELLECRRPEHSSKIKEGSALTGGARLFLVLEPGPHPVMWYVGKRAEDRRLRLAAGDALAWASVQVLDRMLVPEGQLEGVDLSLSGTVWNRRDRPGTQAKLVGQVLCGSRHDTQAPSAVIARFKHGKFVKFQKKAWSGFVAQWHRESPASELPSWRSIAAAAAKLRLVHAR